MLAETGPARRPRLGHHARACRARRVGALRRRPRPWSTATLAAQLGRARPRRSTTRRDAFVAAGIEPGDRVAIWAPNCWEWVVALLGLQSAGGGGRAAQHPLTRAPRPPTSCGPSRARLLVTVDGFLGNDYVAMLGGEDLPHLERTVVLRSGTRHRAARRGPTSCGSGAATPPATPSNGVVGAASRRRRRHPLHLGHHRQPQGRRAPPTGRRCGLTPTGPTSSGLREGDRYLVVNPFFHAFGYKAGIIACLISGATIVPQPVFDVPTAMRRRRRASASRCSPGRRRSTRRSSTTPTVDRSTCRRCASRSPAPRPIPVELVERMGDELGFETVVTGYGLTEALRHRHHVPPRRRRRDHRHHLRPGHPRRRGARSSTTTATRCRAASRARSSSGATT